MRNGPVMLIAPVTKLIPHDPHSPTASEDAKELARKFIRAMCGQQQTVYIPSPLVNPTIPGLRPWMPTPPIYGRN